MKKITGSFISLVLLIIFSSIVYIWQAESEKEALVSTINSQEKTIAQLQKQIEENTSTDGEVSGVVTSTGSVLGTITFTQTTPTEEFIVCGREIRTQQEYCTSPEASEEASIYSYSLDIPTGRYEIFVTLIEEEITPTSTESAASETTNMETYYSDFQICDERSNCVSDSQKKRFIDIIANEVQTDIDISL